MAKLRLPLPWRGSAEKKTVEDRAIQKALASVAAALVVDDELSKGFGNPALSMPKTPGSSWSNQGGTTSRLIARVTQNLASSFGRAPEELEAAMAQQGLSWGPPFPPGRPLDPFWGYRRPARTFDYPVGTNTQLTPRSGRVSFQTIKALWEAYDVAQICTRHLINDVRSLDRHFEASLGVRDDVSDDIRKAREFFDSPDKRQPFGAWLHEYLMDAIRYDAGALYIRRNNAGEPIALEVVNGTTIIPNIDFYGRVATDETDESPDLTAAGTFRGKVVPAYTQIIEGMPWDWLAADDIIYQPINPMPDSQYGLAPLEAVLLTANTDLRFQWHFLNFFSQGSIPQGFMEAPPTLSDPTQIAEWQQTWDAVMVGDQAKLRQIRWVPAGAKYTPVGPGAEKFDSEFPLYLMRRTCAAHGITPADLGFTDTVNKATSETQVDVQFRVGTLPLVRHVEDVINLFLTEHLKLRVRLRFDTGREIEDRLSTAQAEQIYINSGVISPDEPRARLGYPVSLTRPTPRFVNNTRSGPIPMLAIESLAGEIDPETFGPTRTADYIDHPFVEVPGVMPPIGSRAHAEAVNASALMQENMIADARRRAAPNKRDGKSAGNTGNTGNAPRAPKPPKVGHAALASGKADPNAPKLGVDNAGERYGSKPIKKPVAKGSFRAAGIAVVAQDSGRVLMIQRDNEDESKKASGKWEFPGGLLDDGESPWDAAQREWEEETGNRLPAKGKMTDNWDNEKGPYRLFVYAIKNESDINLNPDRDDMVVTDPDHPNARQTEVMAWWEPKLAASAGKALRKELRDFDWELIDRATKEDLSKDVDELEAELAEWTKDMAAGPTAGITAATGMTGVDLDRRRSLVPGPGDDDDDDDDEAEKSATLEISLRRWRENARNRLRKGLPPRRFVDAELTGELGNAIWAELSRATTKDQIDRAFLGKASARPEPGEPEQGLSDALRSVIPDDLILAAAMAALNGAAVKGLKRNRNEDPIRRRVLAVLLKAELSIENVIRALLAIFQSPSPGREMTGLSNRAQPIAEGLVSALRFEIADAISAAAASGGSEKELVAAAQKAIDRRAKLDAKVEARRAAIATSHDLMRANGALRVAWAGGKCVRCQRNAAASPIGINDAWPDGPPPVHPECDCNLIPA